MRLICLQGESQVHVFHLLVEVGFSHFMIMNSSSFIWFLVAVEIVKCKVASVVTSLLSEVIAELHAQA